MNKMLDFTEFKESSIDNWRSLVQKELKDQPFETLIWRDENGLIVEPYLTSYQPKFHVPERTTSTWKSSQTIEGTEHEKVHASIMEALTAGAQRICLRSAISSKSELDLILKDVLIEIISIEFFAQNLAEGLQLAGWIAELATERGLDAKSLEGSIRIPQNELLQNDNALIELASFTALHLSSFKTIVIDADEVHLAQGNDLQELVYGLSYANEIVQRLLKGGLTIDAISALFLFSFQTGTTYFVQIAKFQAFRALWSTLVKAYNPVHACSIHCLMEARNSMRDQSEKDAFNNVLRATTEALGAIVGSADFVDVFFPAQFSTGFSESAPRIGRNIMHILAEESYLNSVKNPTKGAYFISHIVDQMIEKSWDLFQQIENKGGIVENRKWLMDEVTKNAVMQKELVDTGKRIIIGVNKYQPKS